MKSVYEEAAGLESPALVPEQKTKAIVDNSFMALERLSKRLQTMDYEVMDGKEVGQQFAYVAKAIDQIIRLRSFDRGEADQRVQVVGIRDLLKFLTQDQFTQVVQWIEEGEAVAKAKDVSALPH